MRRFSFAVLAVAALGSCMQYDFFPVKNPVIADLVTEIAVPTKLRPNIVVLLDRSGSMQQPIDAANPACPASCGQAGQAQCPAACPTRISEVRRAMDQFLTSPARSLARWGFAAFPENALVNQCSATSTVSVSLPAQHPNDDDLALAAAWDQGALDVNARIQALSTGGGTPTAPSLAFLGTTAGLTDAAREDVVLLLTDGLPNCNPSNPNGVCTDTSPAQVAACACTTGASCATAGMCSLGCLDQGATTAVADLKARDIATVVVGFGADTASSAAANVLNAMARQGGYPRACRADADCGAGDTCGGGVCGRAYYQASTAAELTAVLERIKQAISDPERYCRLSLANRPVDGEHITVEAFGQNLPAGPGTWTWDAAAQEIRFQGDICAGIMGSSPTAPLKLKVSFVTEL